MCINTIYPYHCLLLVLISERKRDQTQWKKDGAVMLDIEVLVSCIQHEMRDGTNKWLALPRIAYDGCIFMGWLIATYVSPAFETNYIFPVRPVFPGEQGHPAHGRIHPFSVQKARVPEPHYGPSYKLALTPSRASGALVRCARRACT
jgi:hypothetical protein